MRKGQATLLMAPATAKGAVNVLVEIAKQARRGTRIEGVLT